MAGGQILVLGPVALVDGAGRVTPPAMLQRLLTALVLADGRVCRPDELLEVLWGEAPASARKLIRIYVSQLRKALPPGVEIETVGGGYALRLPVGALDAQRFQQLVEECRAARRDGGNAALAASLAEQALALWRGRAFGDLAYEELARAESERLEELRLVALEERLDACLSLGRHADVLAEAVAFADEQIFRERAHELAMVALYRCGRQSEALAHYAIMRRRLSDELGLEPGTALRELQRRMLQQDPELAVDHESSPLGDDLPVPPNPLVGRERELEQLAALLARRDASLIVLTGAGGSGKTRLALEAARRASASFANGAVLVELASLRDPELVLPTIAHALGLADTPGETPLEALVEAVRARELLLVLDNVEHLRAAAASFVDLVSRAPRLTILVTSRAVLHVSGEHVFPVDPLDDDAALELFEQRALSLQPAFRMTEEDRAVIRRICRRLDGLPLAIELAAARIRTLTLRALLDRLDASLTLLTSGARDLPARQQTLRETINWSVGLLPDDERRVFARLAVFPAGATLDAAEAVCGADVDTLGALVDDHVVRRVDAEGEPRFGLLETIREYAYELLGDDRDATDRALALHFRDLVDESEETLTEDPVWLARFDAELDNLRRALDVAAADPDPELELQLAGGLWRFWWTRGYLDEGIARLEAALGRATEISAARVRAARGLAGLSWSRGRLELAEERATEALALADATGSTHDLASAHTILGIIANQRKDFETARQHHEQNLAILVRLGIEPVVPKLNLGIVAMDSGDPAAAVPLFADVLEAHRRNDNPSGIGFATLNLGQAHHRLGDIEHAEASFREARDAFSQVGFRAHAAHALQGLAACEASAGGYVDAAGLLGQASAELGEIVYAEEDFPLLAAEVEAVAREALGDEAFDAAHAAGRSRAES